MHAINLVLIESPVWKKDSSVTVILKMIMLSRILWTRIICVGSFRKKQAKNCFF